MDFDDIKVSMARAEATAQQIVNINFQVADLEVCELASEFDLAHARFILQHLQDPERLLLKIWKALRPGGVVVVTDTDFRGYFSEPDNPDLRRHVELYTETVKRRGGDPNIGPRLPALLTRAGFENVQLSVVQHASTGGEIKLITPLSMENEAEAVVAEGLASKVEVDRIVSELYKFARDPETVLSGPRIIQTWAYRPAV